MHLLTDLGLPSLSKVLTLGLLSFTDSIVFPGMWKGTSWKIWNLENSNEQSRKGEEKGMDSEISRTKFNDKFAMCLTCC